MSTSLTRVGRPHALAATLHNPDDRRNVAHWLTGMAGLAAVAGTAAPFLPGYQVEHPRALLGLGVFAMVLGIFCVVVDGRMNAGLAQVLFVVTLGLVCVAVESTGTKEGVYGAAIYIMWVPLGVALFFSTRTAYLFLGLSAAALGGTLSFTYRSWEMLPVWVNVMLVSSLSTLVVTRLAERNRLLAREDGLTGLPNRRFFDQTMELLIAAARRSHRPLCLVLVDLDGFKQVNDERGHVEGDRLLVRAAEAWCDEIRGSDLLARIGGDEFAVLLPDTSAEDAQHLIDRLHAATPDIAFSAGVCQWDGQATAEEFHAAADAQMYADKRGRR